MIENGEGFAHDLERLGEAIRQGAAAVVLVDPANPTASVLTREELNTLAMWCLDNSCVLILDETYERLVFDDRERMHPWIIPDLRGNVLTVGSFSKSLGMAGWRLGYLFGNRLLMEEAYKVHDSVAICSPLPAQALLKAIIEGPHQPWMRSNLAELTRRRQQCRDQFTQADCCLQWRRVDGGIFSLLAYDSEIGSLEMTQRILRETGVVLVPGRAFGPGGEHHVRLSFGSSSTEELDTALERLTTFRLD
jgi:aspartate/methionine/tyrosine aminotransferase